MSVRRILRAEAGCAVALLATGAMLRVVSLPVALWLANCSLLAAASIPLTLGLNWGSPQLSPATQMWSMVAAVVVVAVVAVQSYLAALRSPSEMISAAVALLVAIALVLGPFYLGRAISRRASRG